MYKLCGLSFTLLIVCVVVNCSSLQINETTHFQIGKSIKLFVTLERGKK